MPSVRHVLVARAASSVRFALGEVLRIDNVPAGKGRAGVILQTRYAVEGYSEPIPRELFCGFKQAAPVLR